MPKESVNKRIVIPRDIRIIIIEGIAGAGKTSLHKQLISEMKNKVVYDYSEEDCLLGWKQNALNEITQMRIALLNKILDFIGTKLKENPKNIFLFDRFHLSVAVLDKKTTYSYSRKYNQLLKRIKKLPVLILIPILSESQIVLRSSHSERGVQWQEYLKERLRLNHKSSLESLYSEQQNKLLKLAKLQKIPFKVHEIRGCWPLMIPVARHSPPPLRVEVSLVPRL